MLQSDMESQNLPGRCSVLQRLRNDAYLSVVGSLGQSFRTPDIPMEDGCIGQSGRSPNPWEGSSGLFPYQPRDPWEGLRRFNARPLHT